jgi:hypothetical protein
MLNRYGSAVVERKGPMRNEVASEVRANGRAAIR